MSHIIPSEDPPPPTQLKQRKRKGSLRKTALLGTRKFRNDARARRGSNSLWRELERPAFNVARLDADKENLGIEDYRSRIDEEDGSHINGRSGLGHDLSRVQKISSTASVSSTDDEDVLLFSHTKPSPLSPTQLSKPSDSPPSSTTTKSSLNFPLLPDYPPEGSIHSPESSDSTTAFYGYLILLLTWITFIIGIGSCLDIWSWAWDVGTTPPAPPELHDDETLPITGYYPALIILTGGVVSWVWCGFAWVGMKYFRHAKEGDR
jgi:hypothetical protein